MEPAVAKYKGWAANPAYPSQNENESNHLQISLLVGGGGGHIFIFEKKWTWLKPFQTQERA